MKVFKECFTKIVIVTGVREGVGATTVSAGLGLALKSLAGGHLLLVDADEKNSDDLEMMLKANGIREVGSVREDFSMYNDDVVRSCLEVNGLGIGVVRSHSSKVDTETDIISVMKKYDWVIVDAGVDMRISFKELLKKGACCLVVGEETGSGEARLRRRLRGGLVESCGVDRIIAVVNKSGDELVKNIANVKETCQIRYDKMLRNDAFEALSRIAAAEKASAKCDIAGLAVVLRRLRYDPVALEGYKLTGEDVDRMKEEILFELQKTFGAKKINAGTCVLKEEMEEALRRLIPKHAAQFLNLSEQAAMARELLEEALGTGPLEALLADPAVTDVMVNGHEKIYVEKDGRLSPSIAVFRNKAQLERVIERVVAPLGRRVDESSPMADARLFDGSRVNVILPPLAINGPVVTIRKFRSNILSTKDLIAGGAMSCEIADFLERSVKTRLNILVSGGTGSGKTTLLNVLSAFIPESERIITIEDSAELKLAQAHVVSLEARPPNIEGRGEVTIRDLVRNSLRMRPDRIIVGECRGGEALDMLQAMNTGHDGSMTTIHANSARDALSRLETLVLFSGLELPSRVVREQIVSAIDLIVQLARCKDGRRRVSSVTEVVSMEGDRITTQEIFYYTNSGASDGNGFVATGFVPTASGNRS